MINGNQILSNDFVRQWADVESAVLQAVSRVGASGWYVLGREVSEFENKLAELWGISDAVGCGNGMDAIEIALRALGLQPGEKVITTPLSAYATTLAILRAGGQPVFLDVDESGLLDLEAVGQYLESQDAVRFLVPVHLYGKPLDLDRLEALKRKYHLTVIEDCAQSVLAAFNGRACGTVGDAAAVSFYPTKNLGGMGDGGALLTSNPDIAARARSMRNYGQAKTYQHIESGLNSRLDEVQAAILADAMLPRLVSWTECRRRVASRYLAEIKADQLCPLPDPERGESVWHLFPVLVAGRREAFMAAMREAGILTGIHYPTLIPDQPVYLDVDGSGSGQDYPVARQLAAREVSLPIHPFLTDQEIDRVVAACNAWRP